MKADSAALSSSLEDERVMLNLANVLPGISKYKKMKILGAGRSINKYGVEDVKDADTFYVILNHFNVVPGIGRISDAPILFFAHDYHTAFFDDVLEKKGFKTFLSRDNVYFFLHNRQIDHQNCATEMNYPEGRVDWVKNLYYYEKAQSNIKYFENTTNSLLAFSSTLHSPLSLPIGNDFITEVHLYGLDLYIYQSLLQYDQGNVGHNAPLIFNANKLLLNYLNTKREQLKIVFYN